MLRVVALCLVCCFVVFVLVAWCGMCVWCCVDVLCVVLVWCVLLCLRAALCVVLRLWFGVGVGCCCADVI